MEGRASKPHRPAVDPQAARRSALRSCLGRFATGVAVVRFDSDHARHGITVNSFTSVSLDPPLVLVSVDRCARSHDLLHERAFTVNVLGAEQEALARRFAGGADIEPVWVEGDHAPRLAGVLAHLECTPWRAYDGGDHTLFLGEIVGFDFRDGDALAYHTSRFTTVAEQLLGHEHLI
jgi:flavin reductase (DIM6/NTAB) family NADH-FMN oxidoreductase RutF